VLITFFICFYWSTMFSLPVPGYPEGSELRIDMAICLSKIHIFRTCTLFAYTFHIL
jgi:hypothetical protein